LRTAPAFSTEATHPLFFVSADSKEVTGASFSLLLPESTVSAPPHSVNQFRSVWQRLSVVSPACRKCITSSASREIILCRITASRTGMIAASHCEASANCTPTWRSLSAARSIKAGTSAGVSFCEGVFWTGGCSPFRAPPMLAAEDNASNAFRRLRVSSWRLGIRSQAKTCQHKNDHGL
jgi:hypothetical protein